MSPSKKSSRGVKTEHERNSAKLFAINSGHIVKDFFLNRAVCGARLGTGGWGYEEKSESANWCTKCSSQITEGA